jgi:adenosylcobinamide kinase/adenosylcobinamide-phosphate guanylyltransferase
MAVTLVLGGARSGKSAYAQRMAEEAAAKGGRLVMLATAEALDDEMRARIEKHQADRGDAWATVEAAMNLPQAILKLQSGDIAVVDCLTLWISNLMMRERNVEQGVNALLTAVNNVRCPLWLVSNEVGMGIVPENAMAREFRDHCGRMHQQLAAKADSVAMVVAGLPLTVK